MHLEEGGVRPLRPPHEDEDGSYVLTGQGRDGGGAGGSQTQE